VTNIIEAVKCKLESEDVSLRNKIQRCVVYWNGGIASHIRNLYIRWRLVVNFTPGRFTSKSYGIGGWVDPIAGADMVVSAARILQSSKLPVTILTELRRKRFITVARLFFW
jgi:hypothetical protein